MSHDTEESENSLESPHLKHMRKQCVPGTSPFFVRAGDEANLSRACMAVLCSYSWPRSKWRITELSFLVSLSSGVSAPTFSL